MAERKADCYIDVWRDADFRGERTRISGPAEYPALDFAEGRWGDDIGSLRVGPNAFVMAFRHRDFQDELITFGPNDEVADLGQFKFDDDIESVRVIDSLKIFERVGYNSAPEHAAPEADAGDAASREPANPHKGRRRPGPRR
ncbi:MAG: hypothetical protein LC795_11830 [Acidobacteria bacterium]|nr:hypothetical protein [Acidobacteriota bacterium]